jgi:hypothetical protein
MLMKIYENCILLLFAVIKSNNFVHNCQMKLCLNLAQQLIGKLVD